MYMYRDKQYIITTIAGALLVMLGLLSTRFIIISPNRIIAGEIMSTVAVLKDNYSLFTALFLIFGILLIRGIFKPVSWYYMTGASIMLLLLLLWSTGNVSETMNQNFTSAARTSLGIGFWETIIGLCIMIESSLYLDGRCKISRQFIVFTVVGLCSIAFWKIGLFDHIGIIKEVLRQASQFKRAIIEHINLSLGASFFGLIIGIMMSYRAYVKPSSREVITGYCNMIQVIPTLSMLGILIIPLTVLSQKFEILNALGVKGIGFFPAFIVLTGYTLLPIVSSSLSGLDSIDSEVLRAAKAMGMTKYQILIKVELPLALPAVVAGFKIALVQSIGNAILAGLVGGGGLGRLLFLGLAQSANDLVIITALIIMMIALFMNAVLSLAIVALNKNRRQNDYA